MKKSKILGIGLGCAALTAVAIATPVIATSCSTDDTAITAKVKSIGVVSGIDKLNTTEGQTTNYVEVKDAYDTTVTNNNEVTIYSGQSDVDSNKVNNAFVSIALAKKATDIVDSVVLKDAGFEAEGNPAEDGTAAANTIAVTWELAQTEGWSINETNGGLNNAATAPLTATEKTITLTAKLSQTKTDKSKVEKTIKVTVNFKFGIKTPSSSN